MSEPGGDQGGYEVAGRLVAATRGGISPGSGARCSLSCGWIWRPCQGKCGDRRPPEANGMSCSLRAVDMPLARAIYGCGSLSSSTPEARSGRCPRILALSLVVAAAPTTPPICEEMLLTRRGVAMRRSC